MALHFITNSAAETKAIAYELVRSELWPDLDTYAVLILLQGGLGAGKTQFAQAVAGQLGVKEQVQSPTYVYQKEYQISSGKFIHIDAWRIETSTQFELLGLSELLMPGNVVAIEWPKKLLAVDDLKERADLRLITVSIKERGEDSREVEISSSDFE